MLLPILLGGAALFALGTAVGCRITFLSPDKVQNDIYNIPDGEQYQVQRDVMRSMIAEMDAVPFERVSLRSHDGLLLSARYYHTADGAPLSICFHGYRGTAIRDFCGGGQMALELGHNLLLVDQRAHGESQGRFITFGIRERLDCLDWIRWGLDRLGNKTPILLYGISMGGATVLMAAGEDLPDNVRGIIADSPYSSPADIIAKVGRDLGLPPALTMPFLRAGAQIAGFRLEEITAADAVRNTATPILIIHGEDDHFVPCLMSEEIRQANPAIRRYTFPEAGHGISYMKNTPRYRRLVTDFILETVHTDDK